MRNNDNKRMHEMYLRDCFMAWFDVALLWAVVLFVLIAILGIVTDPNIRLVLYAASAMLVLFNTASVYAMTKHFKEDKDYIYGLDLKHLDANRAAKINARRLS
jgi:archaellum biogenesis protein FlaJ (TadC family)